MIQHTVNDLIFELRKGDISRQPDMMAVVNAANAELRIGGGVAGAIHRAAGPELEKECRPLAPLKPGQAVITVAHKLPNQYVIHCLGPIYGVDHPEAQLLANCYSNALHLAEENGITSIAFPAISTGAFGYPLPEAIPIAVDTILGEIPKLKVVKHIVLILYSAFEFEAHATYINQQIKE